jgi:hypothetical protein
MNTTSNYEGWIGATAYDSGGDKIGEIRDIFFDDRTRRPEWVSISTGLFGSRQSYAPLAGAQIISGEGGDDRRLQLAVTKAQVKDAPNYEESTHLSASEEQDLYRHYGFDWNQTAEAGHYGYGEVGRRQRFDADYQSGWRQEWDQRQGAESDDVVATETVRDQQAVVQEQPKTVRLRKHQWTEQVPVQREEVRVETDTKDTTAGRRNA